MNTPHFHLLVLPFVWLPMPVARAVWNLANIAGIAAAVRLVGFRRVPVRWIAAGLWCGGGTTLLVICGQVAGLMAVGVAMVWREARVGRWGRAALWVGVLAALKPLFGLLVLWFVYERQWRTIVLAGLSCAACYAIGATVFGVTPYVDWSQALAHAGTDWFGGALNASWRGITQRVASDTWEPVLRWMGNAVILGATLWHLRSLSSATRLLAMALAAMLLSPIAWAHYLWMLAGPLTLWLAAGHRWPWGAWLLWVPPVPIVIFQRAEVAPWGIPSLYAYGLLALWLAVIRSSSRRDVSIESHLFGSGQV
ncbi:MAG TPA: glycosyltransferase family 87 protein [Vicinamibacterales bacterium]|nr:glycosyltransferase family 87 protein [Vicinamibacterales bacterium]